MAAPWCARWGAPYYSPTPVCAPHLIPSCRKDDIHMTASLGRIRPASGRLTFFLRQLPDLAPATAGPGSGNCRTWLRHVWFSHNSREGRQIKCAGLGVPDWGPASAGPGSGNFRTWLRQMPALALADARPGSGRCRGRWPKISLMRSVGIA